MLYRVCSRRAESNEPRNDFASAISSHKNLNILNLLVLVCSWKFNYSLTIKIDSECISSRKGALLKISQA